jgi:hypothetical protein
MGSIPLESLTEQEQAYLHKAYKAIGDPRLYPYVLSGLRNDILVLIHGWPQTFPNAPEDKVADKTPLQTAVDGAVVALSQKKGPTAMAAAAPAVGLNRDVSLEVWTHGNPPVRTLTADGKRVADWAKSLPSTPAADGNVGKRQGAAVTAAFTKMDLEILDVMSNEDYNHVMAGNGPPRYDFKTGFYYDYGAAPNGDPSGIMICTDPTLLVYKP